MFTPADHFPHSLHVACRCAFRELLDTTFSDATVFQQCTVSMSSIITNFKSRFQSFLKWSRRYSWGCKWSASLPVARILPKPRKSFAKTRPITACDHCWHSRFAAFLPKGVFQIMLVVFPPGSTLNALSVQQVIRIMWHSMMAYPATEPTNMVQQDLIGFFNSVPHDRSLSSCPFATRTQLSKYFEFAPGPHVASLSLSPSPGHEGCLTPSAIRPPPLCMGFGGG